MTGKRRLLIETLESSPILDERFINISVINVNKNTWEFLPDQGSLSVVFKAHDQKTNFPVAIKFLDPEMPPRVAQYRYPCFKREVEILETLKDNFKYLQLIQNIHELKINSAQADGNPLVLTYEYFITEWLEDSIVPYFVNNIEFLPRQRLILFREILITLNALRERGICHRDLKKDNFRVTNREGKEKVILIDFGTAVDISTDNIQPINDYDRPAGAGAYSPFEAICGLAGIRKLGIYTDVYALGAMLYELFNPRLYIEALLEMPGFEACYGSCKIYMDRKIHGGFKEADLIKEWNFIIKQNKNQVSLPDIAGPLSDVIPGTSDILRKLHESLCALDYKDRIVDPIKLLKQVDTAIRIIDNALLEKKKIARRKTQKDKRLEKLNRIRQKQAAKLDKPQQMQEI